MEIWRWGIITFLTLASWPVTADDLLPSQLSPETLKAWNLEEFEQLDFASALLLRKSLGKTFYALSPLGGPVILIQGPQELNITKDRKALEEVFHERHLAGIPPEQKICSKVNPQGQVEWDYPVGTTVAHEIRFREPSGPGALFELRVARKGTTGWEYGTYLPEADGLVRATYDGNPEVSFELMNKNAQKFTVKLNRVHLGACQNCHGANSIAFYQYAPGDPGPCGFVPNNPHSSSGWVSRIFTKTGSAPVSGNCR